jgi:acetyl esterase/lipase
MRGRSSLRTERYGLLESQEGDLYLPARSHPPVLCLLHGGFWRMPYGRDQMAAIAQDLASRGFAVWNLEYRRLGEPKGGWPSTFQDVTMGIEHLGSLAANGLDIDLTQVTVIGHSAGGHLALWSAARNRESRTSGTAKRIQIAAVVGQAPLVDLIRAYDLGVGGNAIAELLGGLPNVRRAQYQEASPIELLPLGVPQLLLHGTADDEVPIEMTRTYTQTAKAVGDCVEFVELAETGHMEYLDPQGKAHSTLCDWLLRHRSEATKS